MPATALLDSLPRPLRDAVNSAGYRVLRWAAARQVLQNRTAKGRFSGEVGRFLTRWLPVGSIPPPTTPLELLFTITVDHIHLTGGNVAFTTEPVEQALLHLPALRTFWCRELRGSHFTGLKTMVPPAWIRDPAPVPPGAVIHGLGVTGWDDLDQPEGHGRSWPKDVLIAPKSDGTRINVRYGRNDKDQVVPRSVEALP